MVIDSVLYTSPGGRPVNEDSVGNRAYPDGGIFVVADGLGGHLHGDVASRTAVDSLTAAPPPAPDENMAEWFSANITAANEKLLALNPGSRENIKSTVVTLVIIGGRAYWAHVGDSRLYYFHSGEIAHITEDHSVAYRKFKSGEISREMIAFDDDQPCLLRTLGNKDRFAPVIGTASDPLGPGDAFLMCTDGAWEYLRDEEILIDLYKAGSAREWTDLLLMRIMERIRSGNDNLSIAAVLV